MIGEVVLVSEGVFHGPSEFVEVTEQFCVFCELHCTIAVFPSLTKFGFIDIDIVGSVEPSPPPPSPPPPPSLLFTSTMAKAGVSGCPCRSLQDSVYVVCCVSGEVGIEPVSVFHGPSELEPVTEQSLVF